MDCSGLICLVLRSVIWIAPSFGSLSRTSLNPSHGQNESGLSHLVLISSWIALLFGLDRPVIWAVPWSIRLYIAPSFGSLRPLGRSVVWIVPSFGSLLTPRHLDLSNESPSFGRLRCRFDRSVVWIAPLSFGTPRIAPSFGSPSIAPSFGSPRRWIAPLFGSPRRSDRSVVV